MVADFIKLWEDLHYSAHLDCYRAKAPLHESCGAVHNALLRQSHAIPDRRMSDLQSTIHQTAHEKGWYPEPVHTTHADVDIPEKIVLIISEAIEALEDARRTDRDVLRIYDHDGAPEGFPIELADVVIRTMDLAGALNIDIEAAVMQKMAYNNHRDWRHGNKRF